MITMNLKMGKPSFLFDLIYCHIISLPIRSEDKQQIHSEEMMKMNQEERMDVGDDGDMDMCGLYLKFFFKSNAHMGLSYLGSK